MKKIAALWAGVTLLALVGTAHAQSCMTNGSLTTCSDGTYGLRNGNMTTYSDRTYGLRNGNMTTFSDGRSCLRTGNLVTCTNPDD